MKKLKIPDDDQSVLQDWLVGQGKPIDSVLSVLSETKATLDYLELAEAVATRVGHSADEIGTVLFAFFNLIHTVSSFGEEERREAPALIAYALLGTDHVEAHEAVKERIERVLRLSSLEITSKALGVLLADERVFCSARTISQIRPVFSEANLVPEAAVIVHQLRIVFHAGVDGDRSEFFVSMGRRELESLNERLQRALEKHDQLLTAAEKMGMQVLK